MSTAIKVDGLSKRYWLQHGPQAPYGALRDEIARAVAAPFRAMAHALTRRPSSPGDSGVPEEFWALKDVSFEVQQGDVVGIIGRNGAGKSTLLKILSRITEPTHGRIELNGRVASLLEVGTGFHPELSGRENIFLNGAILGMGRAEIRAKFDEIVAFAEIEKFLDTPVKRYSSGMYVRLSFAVAAHLDPEILVVDEVLAVGDAQFQKKCVGKMEDVSRQEGRTVLFVSHNTGVVAQLCNKAILLERGKIVTFGKTQTVIDRYIANIDDSLSCIQKQRSPGENHFVLATMADTKGERRGEYRFDEEVVISVELFLDRFSSDLELAMRLIDRFKNAVFTIHEPLEAHYDPAQTTIRIDLIIPSVFIAPGKYSWIMCINQPGVAAHDLQNDVLPFRVLESGSNFARYEGANYGSVFARYSVQRAR
jgi:lipopolysaccharide transport system ATP-binding protein